MASGHDKVTRAVRRRPSPPPFGRPDPGSEGVATSPSSTSSSTRAACASRSASVSPGTRMKVPVDCSPAMVAAACSSGKAVSMM
ncbi:hypothetical protein PIB19_22025 [Sphingomonas sp. 7/4-4]|nr:hypothetical protein [Sphingomonas sp. 7/4-4]WBY07897.1 hypothetical protein PIB19_22025 [Sphingomonas sp. 7/4-4]